MGRVSAALLIAACLLAGQASAQVPAMIYGTAGGDIQLFTPQAVVEAGGAAGTPLSDNAPKADGTAAPGAGTAASRDDHVHPLAPSVLPAQSATNATRILSRNTQASGLLWDTAADVVLRGLPSLTGNAAKHLAVNSGATGIVWATPPAPNGGSGATLSDATPKAVGTAAPGVGAKASRDDHVHAPGSSGGGPALSDVGPFAVDVDGRGQAGTTATASRGDHQHPLSATGFVQHYTSTAVPLSSARPGVPGTAATFSRSDHRHSTNITRSATPRMVGSVAVRGSSQFVLPADHVHPSEFQVALQAADAGDCVTVDEADTHNVPKFGPCTGGASLSDATPKVEGTAAAGTGTAASRDDHVHPSGGGGSAAPLADTATRVADSAATAGGSGTNASRGDHQHGLGPIAISRINSVAHPPTYVLSGLPSRVGQGGNVLSVKSDVSGVEWVAPPAELPTITGHGGNALFVNAGATGVEWKAVPGGGGSGGGAFGLRSIKSATVNVPITIATVLSLTSTECAPLRSEGAFLLAVEDGGDIGLTLFVTTGNEAAIFYSEGSFGDEITGQATLSVSATDCEVEAEASVAVNQATVTLYELMGAGSGGPSGPSIPSPTAAGKLQHLRVNAAGAAYELAVPPVGLPATSTGNAGDLPQLGSTGGAVSWIAAATAVFNALPAKSGNGNKFLQLRGAEDAVVWADTPDELPALPSNLGDDFWNLTVQAGQSGNKPYWSHELDDALQANAASIGSNTVDLRFLDMPGGTPSEPDATDGQVWMATDCKDLGSDQWQCTGDWEEPVYTRRVMLTSGQTGSNSFAIAASSHNLYTLMQSAATAFQRFEIYIEDRNNVDAANFHCNMAGVRPGGTLVVTGTTNHFYGVMAGTNSVVRCSMNVPTNGNTTGGWDDPGGSSNKHYWVYGVRTP